MISFKADQVLVGNWEKEAESTKVYRKKCTYVCTRSYVAAEALGNTKQTQVNLSSMLRVSKLFCKPDQNKTGSWMFFLREFYAKKELVVKSWDNFSFQTGFSYSNIRIVGSKFVCYQLIWIWKSKNSGIFQTKSKITLKQFVFSLHIEWGKWTNWNEKIMLLTKRNSTRSNMQPM